MLTDLRFGARLLVRAPVFAAVAILSLAIGIGANAAIFGAINGLLLKAIAARDPERLVAIFTSDFSGPLYRGSSYPDAIDFAQGTPALAGLAVSNVDRVTLTAGTQPERVYGEYVSPNYFDLLGVGSAAGRLPSGALTSSAPTDVVLTHRFWQRRFNGDPGVIGRSVRLDRGVATIVGVVEPGYAGLTRGLDLDVFVVQPSTSPEARERTNRGLAIVGRLRPDATVEQAQAQLSAVAATLHRAHRQEWSDVREQPRRVTVAGEQALRLPPDASGPVAGFLLVLALTMGLVLLVACANVAGLLVARAADRRAEVAVRLSLGASRGRLVRQLLVEALLLAAIAAGAGLAVAQWLLVALERLRPPVPLPVRLDFAVDGTVLAVTAGLAILTAIAFGLAPALQATRGLHTAGSRRTGALPERGRRLPLRATLVVLQVAGSLVLMVLAGLFVRSLQESVRADVGFDADRVLVATVDPSMLDYSPERGAQLYAQLVSRLRALPGVEQASVAKVVPLALDFDGGRRGQRPSSYQPRRGEDMEVHFNHVGPGYLATMGIALLKGRDFTDADRPGTEPVIIVNEAYAARFWAGRDPLGERVSARGGDGPWLRVVGVVANTSHTTRGGAFPPMMFLPFAQHYAAPAKLHLRTSGDPAALAPALRDVVRSVEPALPILAIGTLTERTGASLLPQQIAATLIGAFGAVALLLALLGLYGVLAGSVAQRSREIGVRLALGAAPGSLMRLVLGEGGRLTAIGLVVGLLLAAGAARLAGAFLPGVSPFDVRAFTLATVLLGSAACLAMWLPMRRALAVDPAQALRSE
jgi:predicted permease